MSKPSAKEGVEFICDGLKAFGIQYATPDLFLSGKRNEPSVRDDLSGLASDIFALLLIGFKRSLPGLRPDVQSLDPIMTFLDNKRIGFPDDPSARELLALCCWLLGQAGPSFLEGYRSIVLGCHYDLMQGKLTPAVFETAEVKRVASEAERFAHSKLRRDSANASHVTQILTKLFYLKTQHEDLKAEEESIQRQTDRVKTDQIIKSNERLLKDVISALTKDLEFQASSVKALSFWDWVATTFIEENKVFLDHVSPLKTIESIKDEPDECSKSETGELIERINICISLVKSELNVTVRSSKFLDR